MEDVAGSFAKFQAGIQEFENVIASHLAYLSIDKVHMNTVNDCQRYSGRLSRKVRDIMSVIYMFSKEATPDTESFSAIKKDVEEFISHLNKNDVKPEHREAVVEQMEQIELERFENDINELKSIFASNEITALINKRRDIEAKSAALYVNLERNKGNPDKIEPMANIYIDSIKEITDSAKEELLNKDSQLQSIKYNIYDLKIHYQELSYVIKKEIKELIPRDQ